VKFFELEPLNTRKNGGYAATREANSGTSSATRGCDILGDAPDFVEVGEAGIAMDDAMRRQRRVQLVG
jgi:hypothetical protein